VGDDGRWVGWIGVFGLKGAMRSTPRSPATGADWHIHLYRSIALIAVDCVVRDTTIVCADRTDLGVLVHAPALCSVVQKVKNSASITELLHKLEQEGRKQVKAILKSTMSYLLSPQCRLLLMLRLRHPRL